MMRTAFSRSAGLTADVAAYSSAPTSVDEGVRTLMASSAAS